MNGLPRSSSSIRWTVALVAAALVLGFTGGAVAKGKYDAKNAEKVDGRSAVKSSASTTKRKGKLVATNPKTGRLPDNIIGTAPNAAKLGGFSHAAMSSMAIVPQGVSVSGGAAVNNGVTFHPSIDGTIEFSFAVPPDHHPSSPIVVDLVTFHSAGGPCDWLADTSGSQGQPDGDFTHLGGPNGVGLVHLPALGTQTVRFTYSADPPPGAWIMFRLKRDADNGLDDCGDFSVYGILVRY